MLLPRMADRLHLPRTAHMNPAHGEPCQHSKAFPRTPHLCNGSTTELDDLACKESASFSCHWTVEIIPLIHSPSSLAKNATTRPMSAGTATLFNGHMFASPASIVSMGIPLN